MGSRRKKGGSAASLTAWSLVALAAGLVLGALAHRSQAAGFTVFGDIVDPLGRLWLSSLQMTVLPLVVVYLLAAIVSAGGSDPLGRLGARAIGLFIAMLILAALFTLVVTPPLISAVSPDASAFAALRESTAIPQAARDAATAAPASITDWIGNLLPSNLFDAARRGDVLSLLLFSALLAFAIRQLPEERRLPLRNGIVALSDAMFVLVRWLLAATPLGVLALSYALGRDTGFDAVGMLGGLVLVQCTAMAAFTLLLYPLSAAAGRVSIVAFARAVVPAQLVAVSTRSSIASLPALVEGGTQLGLPASATSFVLPLTVSLYKVNRTISACAKVLFLAHVYGVVITGGTMATFIVSVVLLSFTSVGVPNGGSAFKTLPAYLAAGIPIEGIIIAEAVETIPDIVKTVLNVTGDMSAAAVLSRGARRPVAVAAPVVTTTEHGA